jgi:transcriptional regulator with XRE-family HTH domain
MEDIDNGTEWTVGDRLRKARITAGYKKKQEFADLLHMTVKTLTRYEDDEIVPRWVYLESIASHTGRTVDWLLKGDDSLLPTMTVSDRYKSHESPVIHPGRELVLAS